MKNSEVLPNLLKKVILSNNETFRTGIFDIIKNSDMSEEECKITKDFFWSEIKKNTSLKSALISVYSSLSDKEIFLPSSTLTQALLKAFFKSPDVELQSIAIEYLIGSLKSNITSEPEEFYSELTEKEKKTFQKMLLQQISKEEDSEKLNALYSLYEKNENFGRPIKTQEPQYESEDLEDPKFKETPTEYNFSPSRVSSPEITDFRQKETSIPETDSEDEKNRERPSSPFKDGYVVSDEDSPFEKNIPKRKREEKKKTHSKKSKKTVEHSDDDFQEKVEKNLSHDHSDDEYYSDEFEIENEKKTHAPELFFKSPRLQMKQFEDPNFIPQEHIRKLKKKKPQKKNKEKVDFVSMLEKLDNKINVLINEIAENETPDSIDKKLETEGYTLETSLINDKKTLSKIKDKNGWLSTTLCAFNKKIEQGNIKNPIETILKETHTEENLYKLLLKTYIRRCYVQNQTSVDEDPINMHDRNEIKAPLCKLVKEKCNAIWNPLLLAPKEEPSSKKSSSDDSVEEIVSDNEKNEKYNPILVNAGLKELGIFGSRKTTREIKSTFSNTQTQQPPSNPGPDTENKFK